MGTGATEAGCDPAVIVGTGCCGSTLLAHLLHMHPELCVLSEFVLSVADANVVAPADVLSGSEIAAILGRARPEIEFLADRGLRLRQILYLRPGRSDCRQPTPSILLTTLPWLHDDPERAYAELIRFTSLLPPAPFAEQLRVICQHMTSSVGKQRFVERSGSSLGFVPYLRRLFPDARYVILCRDGPETVMSMRDHPLFRLGWSVTQSLPKDRRSGTSLWPALTRAELLRHSQALETAPPLEDVARMWSALTLRGLGALASVPRTSKLLVMFEELVRDPGSLLASMAEFLGVASDAHWAARAKELLSPQPSRVEELADDDQALLRSACEPGHRAINLAAQHCLRPPPLRPQRQLAVLTGTASGPSPHRSPRGAI